MANVTSDWSTNSSEAVNISLVTSDSHTRKTISTFHPKFTYPIFGDEESIFGYQGLKVLLRYHACDMRPNLQITYNKKFKSVGDVDPTDVKAILEGFLPSNAFERSSVFDSAITDDIYTNWMPPGELVKTITAGGSTYEVWKGNLTDKAVQQQVKRIQILVPFFIEGGTYIDFDDPEWSLSRWTVFFLYKRTKEAELNSSYIFMGYSTVYRYFLFQTPTPPSSSPQREAKTRTVISRPATLEFELPFPTYSSSTDCSCRSRISQFIILPPFQGGGNGSRLYETIFNFYLDAPQTIEITVEDPNEAFDDLRDLNDLARLRTIEEFTSLRINNDATIRHKGRVPTAKIVNLAYIDQLRQRTKIAPRQFSRLLEMRLLSLIPKSIRKSLLLERTKATTAELKAKEHEYHLWKLFVKQRLYRHNKDSLIQLDRSERIDKLEDALDNVEADYARLLRTLDGERESQISNGSGEASGKRAPPEDFDDNQEPHVKKAKVAE